MKILVGSKNPVKIAAVEEAFSRYYDDVELGYVMDRITNTENTKLKSGAIGFFTNGVMDRKELYIQGLIVAMAPFLHKDLYFKS